ncbi:MAG: nucleotidyltransferase domain-containing protein [Candidatus Bathyarchaeia archaeon]
MPKPVSKPRLAYLSRTAIAILKVMVSDLTKEYTVRGLAEGIRQSYRITYETAQRLSKDGRLRLEKSGNHSVCSLNLARNVQDLAFIESLRTDNFLKTNADLRFLVSSMVSKVSGVLPYFTLILFGSNVKGTADPRSDLDVILIVPHRAFQRVFENELASISRISTTGLHELIVTSKQFASMLSTKQGNSQPNVATETLASHIIPYGAEAFYNLVSRLI